MRGGKNLRKWGLDTVGLQTIRRNGGISILEYVDRVEDGKQI